MTDKHTYMMIACVAVGVVLCCMAATPLFGGPLSTVLALIPGGLLIAAGMTIESLADDLAEPRAWCATPKPDLGNFFNDHGLHVTRDDLRQSKWPVGTIPGWTPSAAPYWLDEHRADLKPRDMQGRTLKPDEWNIKDCRAEQITDFTVQPSPYQDGQTICTGDPEYPETRKWIKGAGE